VQLTAIFDENNLQIPGPLAASRVTDGRFSVRSAEPSQPFYWEVKAVRGNIDPLIVVSDRPVEVNPQAAPEPAPEAAPEPRKKRSRAA
jgi:hypothetical protein